MPINARGLKIVCKFQSSAKQVRKVKMWQKIHNKVVDFAAIYLHLRVWYTVRALGLVKLAPSFSSLISCPRSITNQQKFSIYFWKAKIFLRVPHNRIPTGISDTSLSLEQQFQFCQREAGKCGFHQSERSPHEFSAKIRKCWASPRNESKIRKTIFDANYFER